MADEDAPVAPVEDEPGDDVRAGDEPEPADDVPGVDEPEPADDVPAGGPAWRPPTLAGLAAQVPRHVPIVGWLRRYDRVDLVPDTLAGLTSWGVMVPVAIAYAGLAGLPPEVGLVTAFVAMAAYAVFGTSRQLKVTTSSTMAVMSVSLVTPLAGGDPLRFAALSAALAIIVGVLLVTAGAFRLGFISEFLAKPVVTGFVIGVAVTVIVGQLPKILGIPATSGSFPEQLDGLLHGLPETDPTTLAIGAIAIAVILVLRRIDRRIPGPLVAMAAGIAISAAADLSAHGVAIVGQIATTLPSPGIPAVRLGDITYLVTGAAGIVFLAVGESLGAARAFAAPHRQEIDADQELVALGAANVAVGLFGGFIVDASLSQTATAEAAGVRTQLSSLITSFLVLLTAIFLAPLFEDLPMAILGAVVIAASIGLIDIDELRRYWRWRRTDALLAGVALVGVITTSVLTGLMIAVLLSLVLLLYRASRPYLAVLGRLPGERVVYADIARHERAEPIDGLLLVRLEAPLYFFNASVARAQVLELVGARDGVEVLIMDVGATHDLDVTTMDTLRQLAIDLRDRGVELALAHARGHVRDRIERTDLATVIGPEHIHLSLGSAVAVETARLRQTVPGAPS